MRSVREEISLAQLQYAIQRALAHKIMKDALSGTLPRNDFRSMRRHGRKRSRSAGFHNR